jgi:hypothetical protein
MAGTVVTTEIVSVGTVKKVSFAWTSSAGGAADATTTAVIDGKLLGFATVPDAVAAPTDNYDITITDAQGLDVLLGQGANRDTANTEYVDGASIAAVASSVLTLGVTNAGNAKEGTAVLWIR